MKHILLCTLLAVVAAATMECPGAVPEDASGKFWTQDNGGGDLGPLVQAHRGSRGEYQATTNEVDRARFLAETGKLREKYGYTKYVGDPLQFHASGMVTFGLLGTKPSAEEKLAFDPDKRRRRAMFADVVAAFPDCAVFIGGTTSFDLAAKKFNKYDATVKWARERGCGPEDIVFIGDDFNDGGNDSHARIGGLDRIVIADYRNFADAVGVLVEKWK